MTMVEILNQPFHILINVDEKLVKYSTMEEASKAKLPPGDYYHFKCKRIFKKKVYKE